MCVYVRRRETLGSTVTTELFSRSDSETQSEESFVMEKQVVLPKKTLMEQKYRDGTPIRRNTLVAVNNFSESSCRKPGQQYKSGDPQQTGRLRQGGGKN